MKEIEDCLSPEELEAATRKITPTYYICYDASGSITSATNMLPQAGDYLRVPYEIFEKFATCRELFTDWVINKTKNSANDAGVELVPKIQQSITFRNNMFEYITNEPSENTDIFIHWDWFNKKWLFYMSADARATVYNQQVGSELLTFYVSYKTNFEHLLRIIEINVHELLHKNIEIPFIHNTELEIDCINLSTRSVFKSYGLKIWREIKE